jgi:hypothetical protein
VGDGLFLYLQTMSPFSYIFLSIIILFVKSKTRLGHGVRFRGNEIKVIESLDEMIENYQLVVYFT